MQSRHRRQLPTQKTSWKLKNTLASKSDDMETVIDHTANKLADSFSPTLFDVNFIVSSLPVIFGAETNSALGIVSNYLGACCQLLMGLGQLSDQRKHRRTTRKIKGLTNIASSTQLLTLTAINSAAYGGPAFAAAFGVAFIHSIDDLYRCIRRMCSPAYWYKDTESELEKLKEELERLQAIRDTNGFTFFSGHPNTKIRKLKARISKLKIYLKHYDNNSQIPPDALKECKKDLIKALTNTLGLGMAFAGMVMACIMPTPALPALVVVSITAGILLLKNALMMVADKAVQIAVDTAEARQSDWSDLFLQIENSVTLNEDLTKVLKEKVNRYTKARITESLDGYEFTTKEVNLVKSAILKGHLRISDILERGRAHTLWRMITFKGFSKQFSKQLVLNVARCSDNTKQGEKFQFVSEEPQTTRQALGYISATLKVLTSAALCVFFVSGALHLIGVDKLPALIVGIALGVCNGIICALSRGKSMVSAFLIQPKQQETDGESKENKGNIRWARKVLYGILTLLACISAGATGFVSISGLFSLFGLTVTLALTASNIPFLLLIMALSVASMISFYSFQATGIEQNWLKFKKVFQNYHKNGQFKTIGLLLLMTALFVTAYATITWFTVNGGISKAVALFGGGTYTTLILTISLVSAISTIFVNTFSQVYKVVELFTTKNSHAAANDDHSQKKPSLASRVITTFLATADAAAYSIAGGILSGMAIAKIIAPALGGIELAWTIVFSMISVIVLLCVAVAFTYRTVPESMDEVFPFLKGAALVPTLRMSHTSTLPENTIFIYNTSNPNSDISSSVTSEEDDRSVLSLTSLTSS